MTEVALASINTFGPSPKAGFESHSEQLITLTYSQLQGLIAQAVQEAIQPLQDRISSLEDRVTGLQEENAALHAKLASLESLQEQDINRICLDIAYDRRRLTALEKVEPQPLQRDRGEILRALITANGGKMLAKDARAKMRMDKGNFSRLLDTLDDYIDTKPLHYDKRNLLLIIK
jgi:hypothetical protein